ncbi:MAG: hypothetical protein NC210_00680 [[Clostridium] fimetarium]|nr:hypothetical protein [Alistipes timonensis]MCM1404918.1 hypothetical protein [[Clostridium] fimetarium]
MKHLMKMFFAAGIAAFALSSCSEDQTEFNVSNVPGRAKISGTIVYNQGTTVENGRFAYNYKPLASHEVILEIPNSYYKSGAEGTAVYTTSTDANGKYSFEVPATNSTGSGTISIRPFESTTTSIKVVDHKPVAETKQAIFRRSDVKVNIKARGLEIENFECVAYPIDEVPESFTKSVAFKVVIGQNMEYKIPIKPVYNSNDKITKYEDADVKKLWQPASGVDFVVEVDAMAFKAEFSVYGTTDSKGECTIQIPVGAIPASFSYEVKPISYLGKFTHYVKCEKPEERLLSSGVPFEVYDNEAVTLDGYYESTGTVSATATYEFANFVQKAECKRMLFQVLPGSDAKGYTPTGWNSDCDWLDDHKKKQEGKK